jgi:membrane-associated protein
MNYGHFVFYNIFGGVGWVCSMVLCGYFLPALLNPLLRPVFGEAFAVEEHVEKVVIVVVLVSIAPGIALWLKSKLAGRKEDVPATNPFSVRSENATCSSECQ